LLHNGGGPPFGSSVERGKSGRKKAQRKGSDGRTEGGSARERRNVVTRAVDSLVDGSEVADSFRTGTRKKKI